MWTSFFSAGPVGTSPGKKNLTWRLLENPLIFNRYIFKVVAFFSRCHLSFGECHVYARWVGCLGPSLFNHGWTASSQCLCFIDNMKRRTNSKTFSGTWKMTFSFLNGVASFFFSLYSFYLKVEVRFQHIPVKQTWYIYLEPTKNTHPHTIHTQKHHIHPIQIHSKKTFWTYPKTFANRVHQNLILSETITTQIQRWQETSATNKGPFSQWDFLAAK